MLYEYYLEIKTQSGHQIFNGNYSFKQFSGFVDEIDFITGFMADDKYLVSVFNKLDYKKVSFYIDNGAYLGDRDNIMEKLKNLFMKGQTNEKKTWKFESVD